MAQTPDPLQFDDLPPTVRTAVEALLEGREVTLLRGDRTLGQLSLRPAGFGVGDLEGEVLDPPRLVAPPMEVPEGVTLVATAIPLSDAARARLSDEFGDDVIVVDFQRAPSTADVLLVHPVSRQLIGILRGMFPRARVVVAEVDDEEFGVHLAGPLTELRDAGVTAYLPPRSLPAIAADVQAVVSGASAGELTSGATGRRGEPLELDQGGASA